MTDNWIEDNIMKSIGYMAKPILDYVKEAANSSKNIDLLKHKLKDIGIPVNSPDSLEFINDLFSKF